MNTDKVRLEIKADFGKTGVAAAFIVLSASEKHNALDEEMIGTITSCLEEVKERSSIRLVVLKGEGKSFCAGADIAWMKRGAALEEIENIQDAEQLANMLYLLYTLPQMTLCRVQGRILGGGIGMAAACDLVAAYTTARFSFPEIRLGLVPATIAPYVIRAIGTRHCKRYFQTGETFDAAQAREMGLVHYLMKDVQEEDQFDALLEMLAASLADSSPAAVRSAKKLCLTYDGRPVDQGCSKESARLLAEIRSGAQAQEGLAAFLEKRRAVFAPGGEEIK